MQIGRFGIMGYIYLIFLKMSSLELGHFGNTLHNSIGSNKQATDEVIMNSPITPHEVLYLKSLPTKCRHIILNPTNYLGLINYLDNLNLCTI